MTTKHTPGPWFIIPTTPCTVFTERRDTKPHMKMEVASAWGRTGEEAKANARLIAAAPELLAALEFARRILGSGDPVTDDVLDYIDAAIAKAKES